MGADGKKVTGHRPQESRNLTKTFLTTKDTKGTEERQDHNRISRGFFADEKKVIGHRSQVTAEMKGKGKNKTQNLTAGDTEEYQKVENENPEKSGENAGGSRWAEC
jgi:hypothetical protein